MLEAHFVNPTLNYIASVKILIRQHSISRPFLQLPSECGAQKKMTWIMNFLGSIDDLEIPSDVLSSLRQAKGRASRSQIPERQAVDLCRHMLMRCSESHLFAMGEPLVPCQFTINYPDKVNRPVKAFRVSVMQIQGKANFKNLEMWKTNVPYIRSMSSELVKKIKAYEQACINVVFHPVLLPAVGMGMLQYVSEHFHDGWFNSSPGNLEQTNKKANLVGNFVPYA
ncbi:hypothetical protein NC651_027366 [Populus alba x Populus x berolinensis]|nr:hypothetical protein NC651_027366 [Populus alba x Populus x berolinensis]